jgi:outer membrane protein assembly factor BamA
VEGRKGFNKFWAKRKRDLRIIGEEPVFLDSSLTLKSVQQLTIYLQKKGYFNAVVKDSVIIKNRKAKVIYNFYPGIPYTTRAIYYSSRDEGIDSILSRLKNSSLIIPGKNSEEDILDKERERLTLEIRDHGYYFFNKNFITFERDSALSNHQVDIYLYVNRQNENIDPELNFKRPVEDHHPYGFSRIYLYTNYDSKNPDKKIAKDTIFYNGSYIIYDYNKKYIIGNPIGHAVFIKSGDLFHQGNVDHTYSRLADLKIFKLINFRFAEVPRDENQKKFLLDANIQLSPLDKEEFKIESEATNNGGNLGLAGSVNYQNRNLFKGAETIELKIAGGLEALRNFADSVETKRLLFFNTYYIGPELSIGVKRFLIPGFIRKEDSAYFSPNTFYTAGFNYQNRPDYKRSIAKMSYHVEKRLMPPSNWSYQWYPFEINSVKVNLDESFYQKLLATNDVNLLYSYRDHLITSGHINFIYNNQTQAPLKNFWFFKINLETAGNSLWLFRNQFPVDSTGKHYVFGLQYAQYIKTEFDLSFHQKIDMINTMVYRFTAGVGYTYANSKDELLPFDKAFFAGGANDIRAWHARTLGPGSYKDTLNIENGGDIKLEANVEYRTSIFKILETALFIDAGNIWVRNDNTSSLPGSQFDFKNILPQTAVGGGVGLRFNFTFFILRTDFAVKLLDPVLPQGNRFVYANKNFALGDVVPNLGIGYPF